MNNGIECHICGYRIYMDEVMIMVSLTRKDNNVYMHSACFTTSLVKTIEKELRDNKELVALLYLLKG